MPTSFDPEKTDIWATTIRIWEVGFSFFFFFFFFFFKFFMGPFQGLGFRVQGLGGLGFRVYIYSLNLGRTCSGFWRDRCELELQAWAGLQAT